MQLTHTADNGLSTNLVGLDTESGILLHELHQGVGHLVHVGLSVRLDGNRDDGLGELHRLEDDGMLLVAEGVTRLDFLETDGGADIAGLDAVEGVLLVGVHLHDTRDAFLLAGIGVVDIRATFEASAVDAEEAKAADIRVGGNLESQCREGGLHVNLTAFGLLGLGVDTVHLGHIKRAGQECRDSVEQRLHPLVLECRAAHDGNNLAGQGGLADFGDNLVGSDAVGVVEELHHQLLVLLGNAFDEALTVVGGHLLEVFRHGDFLETLAVRALVPYEGLVGDEVDNALVEVFLTDRNLYRDGVGPEAFLDLADHAEEVGTRTVHLVDEGDTGHLVLVGLAPDGLRLGFHAAHGAEDGDGAVEHTERTLHLDGEIDMTRSVDDVVLIAVVMPIPVHGGGGGGDSDAAFLFLHHPVHSGRALVGLAELVVLSGIEKNTLGRRRLSGVDVGHYADVACVVEVGHCSL